MLGMHNITSILLVLANIGFKNQISVSTPILYIQSNLPNSERYKPSHEMTIPELFLIQMTSF